jgi:TRAP-type C4-dicarboxylate transport system permease small subunit
MAFEDKFDTPPVTGTSQLPRIAASAVRLLLGLVLIGLVLLNVVNALARATGVVVIGVDEVLVFGMIWMVMLGMLLVTAERGHIALELLAARVGSRISRAFSIVTHSVMAASCAYAAYQSFLFVQRVNDSGQTSMALGMPMLIPHSALVVGFGGTALIAAMLVVSDIQTLLSQPRLKAAP